MGESGAGKSMLRFEAPASIVSGSIFLHGQDLTAMTAKEMNRLRGRKISLAMQDPRRAMDPRFQHGKPVCGGFSRQKREKASWTPQERTVRKNIRSAGGRGNLVGKAALRPVPRRMESRHASKSAARDGVFHILSRADSRRSDFRPGPDPRAANDRPDPENERRDE